MLREKLYVVADVFKNIADNSKIFAFNDILHKLEKDELENATLSFEQGISEAKVDEFKKNLKNKNTIQVESYFDDAKRCSGQLTHKVKAHNTLISEPTKLDGEKYNCLLMIDENCAELSDHVTGKHIQFMVLVEAARQMVNAVTEKFYSDNTMIFLANNLCVKFEKFVYPFRTEMIYEVISKKMKMDGNGKMTIDVSFVQQDQIAAILTMDFTIIDRKFVTKIEENSLKSIIVE